MDGSHSTWGFRGRNQEANAKGNYRSSEIFENTLQRYYPSAALLLYLLQFIIEETADGMGNYALYGRPWSESTLVAGTIGAAKTISLEMQLGFFRFRRNPLFWKTLLSIIRWVLTSCTLSV